MADRRMFSSSVTSSDTFLDMPASSQVLYFHLNMHADDDGFVNNPKTIQRMVGATKDDFKILLAKNYLIAFSSGIVVITHWNIHNSIRKDRHRETLHKAEMAQLRLNDDDIYVLSTNCQPTVNQLATNWQPIGNQLTAQVSIGKDSIEKDSIDKISLEKDRVIGEGKTNEGDTPSTPVKKSTRFIPPTFEEVKTYCIERKNNVNAEQFIDYYSARGWKLGKNSVKDWKACVRTWERNNYTTSPPLATENKTKTIDERGREIWGDDWRVINDE